MAAAETAAGDDGTTAPFIQLSACTSYANQVVAVAGQVTAVSPDRSGYTIGGCLRVVSMDTSDVAVEVNVLATGLLDSTGSTLTEKCICTVLGPNFGA